MKKWWRKKIQDIYSNTGVWNIQSLGTEERGGGHQRALRRSGRWGRRRTKGLNPLFKECLTSQMLLRNTVDVDRELTLRDELLMASFLLFWEKYWGQRLCRLIFLTPAPWRPGKNRGHTYMHGMNEWIKGHWAAVRLEWATDWKVGEWVFFSLGLYF